MDRSGPEDFEISGNTLFLEGQAQGTQNYIRLPSASGFSWTFQPPHSNRTRGADPKITEWKENASMNVFAKATQTSERFAKLGTSPAVPQTAATHKTGGLNGSSR